MRWSSRAGVTVALVALMAVSATVGYFVTRAQVANIGSALRWVAGITVTESTGPPVSGSAIVMSTGGTMLTTYHAVRSAEVIAVRIDGRSAYATPIALAPQDDLAVLQLLNTGGLTAASIGDASSLHAGSSVVEVGSAAGAGGAPQALTGDITATGETVTTTDPDSANPLTLQDVVAFATSTPAAGPGGAVLDSSGNLVGMFVAGSARVAGVGGNTGYMVPVNRLTEVLSELRNGGNGASLLRGSGGHLDIELTDSLSPAGAKVVTALQGTPGWLAGLAPGDVIVAVDSTAVHSATELDAALQQHQGGDTVTISWIAPDGSRHSGTTQLAAETLP
jgi:S1-C subfamily serine protease